jgi:membrane fusion protein (multidrug efflux system)
LDRRSVAAQGQLASSMADAADAQLAMAQDRLTRAQALHARGATSDAELSAATQQLALAQAQLGQARAQGRVSAADGSNHIVRAPFAGTVTRVPSGVGNVVQPGQALFRLEDLSSLVLRSGITERAIPRVRVGDAVELENSPIRGVVRAFAFSLDPVTRRAPIEIAIDNADRSLIGHTLVKGSILTNRPFPAFHVPATAIRGDQTVLVVNAESKIEVRQVQATVETDGQGVVLFGLTPADQVVVRPSGDLTPGREVRASTGVRRPVPQARAQ